jgi:hypothetical protein
VTRKENEAGEWSVPVEPENVLIDNFHRGEGPHIHDPKDYGRRIWLGELSADEAYRRVVDHLERRASVEFRELVQERGGIP